MSLSLLFSFLAPFAYRATWIIDSACPKERSLVEWIKVTWRNRLGIRPYVPDVCLLFCQWALQHQQLLFYNYCLLLLLARTGFLQLSLWSQFFFPATEREQGLPSRRETRLALFVHSYAVFLFFFSPFLCSICSFRTSNFLSSVHTRTRTNAHNVRWQVNCLSCSAAEYVGRTGWKEEEEKGRGKKNAMCVFLNFKTWTFSVCVYYLL